MEKETFGLIALRLLLGELALHLTALACLAAVTDTLEVVTVHLESELFQLLDFRGLGGLDDLGGGATEVIDGRVAGLDDLLGGDLPGGPRGDHLLDLDLDDLDHGGDGDGDDLDRGGGLNLGTGHHPDRRDGDGADGHGGQGGEGDDDQGELDDEGTGHDVLLMRR